MKNIKPCFMNGHRPKLVSQAKVKNLREWVQDKRGRNAKIARKLGVTDADISSTLSGKIGVSLEKYKLIKKAALEVQEEEKNPH